MKLPGGARAWTRTGVADTASRRSDTDQAYGRLADQVDHPEVFDDWSGGYGDAYRSPERRNTYHWSVGMDARWQGQLVHAQKPILLGELVNPVDARDYNFFIDIPPKTAVERARLGAMDIIGLAASQVIQWTPISPTGNVTGIVQSSDKQSYGNRPALFGSWIMLPILDGSLYRAMSLEGGAIYNTNETYPHPARAFVTSGNRLWKAYHGSAIVSMRGTHLANCAAGTDPTLSINFSFPIAIGNGVVDVQDLAAMGDQVFAGAADGLYAGDSSGTFYNLLTDIGDQRHIDNCRDLAIYNGQVHAQTLGGVYAVKPADTNQQRAAVREIGPAHLGDRSPVRGYVRALQAFGPWLYAGLWTGSQSHILAGTDASPGLPYVWHTMQRLPHVARVHRLHVDGATVSSGGLYDVPNRMWVATDASIVTSGTAPVYLWPIPALNGNPLAPDPAFIPNYTGSARIDMPATNWQSPGTPKVWRAVEVWADRLASGAQYGDVYYTVDQGTRTLLGRAAVSPKTTLYFPVEDGVGGSYVTGQSISLSVESFTHSMNTCPVYRSFILRGTERPKSVDTITAVVRIADNVPDRQGTMLRPGAVMLAELRALAVSPTPTQLVDLSGATWRVAVIPPVEEQELMVQGQEFPEVAASIKMAVLSFSAAA
jgi:hypothetical protein